MHSAVMSKHDPGQRAAAHMQQKESRRHSEMAGTRGRKDQRHKASSSNKYKGGKLAR